MKHELCSVVRWISVNDRLPVVGNGSDLCFSIYKGKAVLTVKANLTPEHIKAYPEYTHWAEFVTAPAALSGKA